MDSCAQAQSDPPVRRDRRARRAALARRGALTLGGLAIVTLVLHVALGGDSKLGQAIGLLTRPAAGWLGLAVFCEFVSYLSFACGQRRLVGATGHRLNTGWIASLSVAAQAINNFLPAGYLAANVLNFREFRRRSLTSAQTAWVLLSSSALYIGTLAGLAFAGSEVAGGQPGTATGDVRLIAGGFLVLVVAGAILAVRLGRRGRLRIPGRLGVACERLRGDLGAVSLSRRGLAAAAGLLLGSWLADAGCLVMSCLAVGTTPPWESLLLAYSAAQLVSFLPVTPGGLGLVEGSLTLALVAGGGHAGQALAAVLLYRLISYWGTLPLGAIGYLIVRRSAVRRARWLPAPGIAVATE